MSEPIPFVRDLHRKFCLSLGKDKESMEYCATEHLRMSGVYWGVMAMELIAAGEEMGKDEICDWVMTCYNADGGFGGSPRHDSHILYTLSALQLLALNNALDRVDKDAIVAFIAGLQVPDTGAFTGDKWGEIDTRFSYCCLNALALLGRLDAVNVPKAVEFIVACKNFDGGFGCVPGAESHAGQVFCCVAALSIAGALDQVDSDTLCWWLCERQCDSGGLNGRPEKQADVCYSWWDLSALAILGRVNWIHKGKLVEYILACQDREDGGICDRPGNTPDVYHTYFGIAGLALLGYLEASGTPHQQIDPTYALPVAVVESLGLKSQQYLPAADLKA